MCICVHMCNTGWVRQANIPWGTGDVLDKHLGGENQVVIDAFLTTNRQIEAESVDGAFGFLLIVKFK